MKNIVEIESESTVKNTLYELAREGARKLIEVALQEEINSFIAEHSSLQMPNGKAQIVKNGWHKKRRLILPIGEIPIAVPRTRDRKGGSEKIEFHSQIIPPYLRRAKEFDEFIPFLYLKGVSTNDFSDVLSKLTGQKVNMSAASVTRMKEVWQEDFQTWQKRDLSLKKYVYFWADGIYIKMRLHDEKACVLCIIGATESGTKEIVAMDAGYRESEISWGNLLIDLQKRGLQNFPSLAIGDGALGFWAALRKHFPQTREQRCWVHKMRNVLDKLPDSLQSEAKHLLHEIYQSPTKEIALKAFDKFEHLLEPKYPKAVQCLKKDKDQTLAFYDFPAEHWVHIRSTNVIESLFATVRLRTYKTKGSGNQVAALTMLFKLAESAQKRFRKLRGYKKIPLVIAGEIFINGEQKIAA